MTTKDTPPISAETEQAATVQADLPRNDLALIGTLTGGDAPRALLRAANGKIVTLGIGEKAGRDTILGIEDGLVQLARGQKTYSLTMPKS